MVIMVIAKVTKMSWFDHPEMQAVVQDLIKMCATQQLSRVALIAINDLIIELGYISKTKFLI
jgi:precorrin-4 methylase